MLAPHLRAVWRREEVLQQLQPGLELDALAGLDGAEGAHLGRVAEDGERGGGELRLGLDVLRDVLCARAGFVRVSFFASRLFADGRGFAHGG